MGLANVETTPASGVSIIIPAYNAERTLGECLQAATTVRWPGELEIIVVNDGSSDKTSDVASSFPGVRTINLPHMGAAPATNFGIKSASHDIVVLLDADAVLEKGWLEKIITSLYDPSIAAVAGYAVTANSSVIGKIAGYDVESRLDKLSIDTDHLYTMNTAYRRGILLEVGLLEEDLEVGYDADLSRKLKAAGYRLILRKDVTCRHYWRDDLKGYLRQQYKYAYYRMELAHKFGKSHDQFASLKMVLQVPFTMGLLLAAGIWSLTSPSALFLVFLLPFIHIPRAFSLLINKRDVSILLLPLLFTVRNLCWLWAAVKWGVKHIGYSYSARQNPPSIWQIQQLLHLRSKAINK